MARKTPKQETPSKRPKWYNVLLFVLFMLVLCVVGMFWIGPW